MKAQKLLTVIILLGLLLAPLAAAPQPAAAQTTTVYSCLPSCQATDGRMLTIAGVSLSTLVGINISLKIASPADAANVEIGFFDGDASGMWDTGGEQLTFTLFADPTARGASAVQLASWSGSAMPDNAWYSVTVPNAASARSRSGVYFYHLRVSVANASTAFLNNFKVRSGGIIALLPRPFAYMATSLNALNVIYPNYPDLSITTYDGSFEFHAQVATSLDAFKLWDGDLDYGKWDGSTRDTDDFNTDNTSIPSWSTAVAQPEGVAVGFGGSSGNPPDDTSGAAALRAPSVTYTVSPLDLTSYLNTNPSGNLEWEMFSVSSSAAGAGDYTIPGRLPSGLYHVRLEGMDMTNLNAWRFPWDIVGVSEDCPDNNPCRRIPGPNLIGDYVWRDSNRDGVQDAGEAPIAGVRVELFDGNGVPLLDNLNQPIFAVTDANGWYNFDVEPRTVDEYTQEVVISGTYTVVVASSNFQSGGPLFNLVSTTGGNALTRTVVTDNILTYDFGYETVPPNPDPNIKRGPYPYGYLRRHAPAWPAGPFTLGGVSYTNEEALALFNTPGRRDMTYRIAWQALATKLNIAFGYPDTCVVDELATVDAWLTANPVGSGVLIDDPAWLEIRPLYTSLGLYNIGRRCATRR